MRTRQLATLVADIDRSLAERGFTRTRRSQTWHRAVDTANDAWVHLNVGREIVNLSVGVTYVDLTHFLPDTFLSDTARPVVAAGRMLTELYDPPHWYSLSDGAAAICEDLNGKGMATICELLDRPAVLSALRSPRSRDWPVLSGYSGRIRLLPLLLAGLGERQEALQVADDFSGEARTRDQFVPTYDAFHDALRARMAV